MARLKSKEIMGYLPAEPKHYADMLSFDKHGY